MLFRSTATKSRTTPCLDSCIACDHCDAICLQDIVEQAHAELYRAQAEKLMEKQEETT